LVYEKRLAIEASADYTDLSREPFVFIFSALVAPGKEIKEVENALDAEIEKIKSVPPSADEVQKAKNQVEASFEFARDSSYSEALYTGMFQILGDWKLKERYLGGIRNVTAAEVQDVARRYLTKENRTIGYLVPRKREGRSE
jgi:zinc protease